MAATLTCEERENGRWILLKGELDHVGARELQPSLREAASGCGGRVVVDLADVTFVGSHALRLLLEANHALGKSGGAMEVSGLRPVVRKVFETTGIFDAIPEYRG